MKLVLTFMVAIGIAPIVAAQANPTAAPLCYAPPARIWESPDGNGGTFGIEIQASASCWYPLSYVGAATQYSIGVYHRSGETVKCEEENYFTTGPLGEHSTTYDGSTLQIHYVHAIDSETIRDIDLDLKRDSATNTWSGTFHRRLVNTTVHLALTSRRSNQGGCIFEGPLPFTSSPPAPHESPAASGSSSK